MFPPHLPCPASASLAMPSLSSFLPQSSHLSCILYQSRHITPASSPVSFQRITPALSPVPHSLISSVSIYVFGFLVRSLLDPLSVSFSPSSLFNYTLYFCFFFFFVSTSKGIKIFPHHYFAPLHDNFSSVGI